MADMPPDDVSGHPTNQRGERLVCSEVMRRLRPLLRRSTKRVRVRIEAEIEGGFIRGVHVEEPGQQSYTLNGPNVDVGPPPVVE